MAAYPAVWLAWRQVDFVYRSLVAEGLEFAYLRYGRGVEFELVGDRLTLHVGRGFEAYLDAEGIDANVAFLLTLLLVTPGMIPSGRLKRVALGLALLLVTHVIFMVVKVQVALLAAEHPLGGSPVFWSTLDNMFEITGRAAFPILIWLGLTLPFMLGELEVPTARVEPVGRNEPCPCGSGRKYKRCCGA